MEREKQNEKMQKVIKELIKKIDADPYDQESYYALGTVLTEEKSFAQAEELFKKALNALKDKTDDHDLLHYGLGNVYYASELYDEAIKEFEAVKNKKLKTQAYIMLAQAYYAKGDYQKALVFALTASEQAKSAEVYSLMGDCFLAMGEFTSAKMYYEKALALSPDDVLVNFQLGVVSVVLGEDSAKYFEKAEKLDPKQYEKLKTRLNDVEQTLKQMSKKA